MADIMKGNIILKTTIEGTVKDERRKGRKTLKNEEDIKEIKNWTRLLLHRIAPAGENSGIWNMLLTEHYVMMTPVSKYEQVYLNLQFSATF